MSVTISVLPEPYGRVTVEGGVDLAAMPRLHAHLHELLDAGVRYLVVDVSRVRHCDCRVVDVLAQVSRRLRADQGLLHIIGLAPGILTRLESLTLPEVFRIYHATLELRTAGWAPPGGSFSSWPRRAQPRPRAPAVATTIGDGCPPEQPRG